MALKKLVALGSALTLALPACSWTALRTVKPEKAVMAAAKAGPEGFGGVFKMTVAAVGHQGGKVFLNSQSDYRDPRNLTIAMTEATAEAVERKAGLSDASGLIGRKIYVRGSARTVRVNFIVDGRPTGKYYYQTHVAVSDPVEIAVKDHL